MNWLNHLWIERMPKRKKVKVYPGVLEEHICAMMKALRCLMFYEVLNKKTEAYIANQIDKYGRDRGIVCSKPFSNPIDGWEPVYTELALRGNELLHKIVER